MHPLLLIVSLLSAWIAKLLYDAGVFTSIHNISPSTCSLISDFPGIEDLHVHASGEFWVGSTDPRSKWFESVDNKGDEVSNMFDLRSTGKHQGSLVIGRMVEGQVAVSKVTLEGYDGDDFHPHGIYLAGETVYVVTHTVQAGTGAPERHEVITKWSLNPATNTATYLATFHSPLFRSINDLVALSDDSFLVTNWRYFPPENPLHLFELYLKLPISPVLYCDFSKPGEPCHEAARMSMPNGIVVADDGVTVSVASSLRKTITSFIYSPTAHTLTPSRTYHVAQLPDNLTQKDPHTLVVAGHPKAFSFKAHSHSPKTVTAPCQVETINTQTGAVAVVYVDDGLGMSACSVAVYWKEKLLVGAVFDEGVMVCDGY